MPVELVSAEQAMASMGNANHYSCIIDARSEDEFALDHLPQAQNWPSLSNEERVRVGTLYKQVGAFEANKLGAALVAANIAKHIETRVMDLPKNWRPLVYCWRGGKRSGSLALVLGQIGFKVSVIEGGYKAFRAAVVQHTSQLVLGLHFKVITGPTGSGKTRLLHALAAQGAQVLDLEALAVHRSSVLGRIPGQAQPSQKHFDMRVWNALRQLDANKVVYVEAESKKVGNVSVPDSLIETMRASECIDLSLQLPERVALLMEDYAFFAQDPALFCDRLQTLVQACGKPTIAQWQQMVHAGKTQEVVEALLQQHYDPTYARSVERNFRRWPQAHSAYLKDRHPHSLQDLAQQLIQTHHIPA
ncbi:MAG: tRNA 2-selenouridine(34) synthase MnmH [Betaproteobacteria bacterium]|nr:tRNA 2-selenouridine(34) synthase MnmH [Betaproteobacteria bacterium]